MLFTQTPQKKGLSVGTRWLLPSGFPIDGQGRFSLSQPTLRRACHSRQFRFFDATLLLVCSGQLILSDGTDLEMSDPASIIVAPRGISLDVTKVPDKAEGIFQSVFLTFSQQTIEEFYRCSGFIAHLNGTISRPRKLNFDEAFADTLSFCIRGLVDFEASLLSQTHRLIGVLIALAERGHYFSRAIESGVTDRLRDIIKENPSHPWTAPEVGHALAMSEATLRRRLAKENTRFESLLAEVRMHLAMTLLQTTTWSIPQIAKACGYRSRTRFTERFHGQFGCLPSQAR